LDARAQLDSGPHRSGSGSVVRIRTLGLSVMDRQLLIATAVGAAIGYPLVAFAVVDATQSSLVLRLSIFSVVLVAAVLAASNIQAIRRVDIDAGGVTLRYTLRSVRVRWSDFLPPPRNPFAKEYGGTFLRRRVGGAGRETRRGHFVTRDQARAIMTHPNWPNLVVDADLRGYLGLDN
jgi:hypothetical protein